MHYYLQIILIYPPKGASIAEPVWGPIDFTYIFIVVYERTLMFQNTPYYPPF